jgi:hypothetical protein
MAASVSNALAIVAGLAVVATGAGVVVKNRLARSRAGAPAVSAISAPRTGALPELVLHVPHAPGSILLDGDTDDPGWTKEPGPARTHAFMLPDGTPARPFSEVRMVWGDGYLYFSLYAADEDIESRTTAPDGPLWLDDAFRVVFTRGDTDYAIEVSPRAILTDSIRHGGGKWDYGWQSGAHASPEMDGTLNDAHNTDEEWVIEMAVPFESVGLKGESGEAIGFAVSRCDTPKNSSRVCAGWGDAAQKGRLVLE